MNAVVRTATAIAALHVLCACAGHALHDAIRANDAEGFRAALAEGEDVEAIHRKDSPLLLASWLGRTDMVALLLDAGADPNAANNEKQVVALHTAAHSGHLGIVDLLARAGARLEAKNINGHTALHLASMEGHTAVVERLLELGSDIDAQANGRVTPLHEAAFLGRGKIVELLLRHGADAHARTAPGKTPEDLARAQGHPEIAAVFESVRSGERRSFEEAEAIGTSAAFEAHLRRFPVGRHAKKAKDVLADRRFRESVFDPESNVTDAALRPDACLARYDVLRGVVTGGYSRTTMVGADESGTTVARTGPWINLCRKRTIVVKTCWLGPNGEPVQNEARVEPLDLHYVMAPAAVTMGARGEIETRVASLVKQVCFEDAPCDFPYCLPIDELPMLRH